MTTTDMIRQYIQAWNEKDRDSILAALRKCYSAESTYIDPSTPLLHGLVDLATFIYSLRTKIPGMKIEMLSEPDAHHNSGRFRWKTILPDEERQGMDYFEFNAEHRITRVVGFFGELVSLS